MATHETNGSESATDTLTAAESSLTTALQTADDAAACYEIRAAMQRLVILESRAELPVAEPDS